jgi:hypothetical protein
MSFDLIVIGAIFVASVCVALGLSLFVLTVVLKVQHKHRQRLARVGRRRMSGRLDIDDVRLSLVRQKQKSSPIEKLVHALSRSVPLLNTTRLRANFRRANLDWSIGTFVAVSLVVAAAMVALGVLASGRSSGSPSFRACSAAW